LQDYPRQNWSFRTSGRGSSFPVDCRSVDPDLGRHTVLSCVSVSEITSEFILGLHILRASDTLWFGEPYAATGQGRGVIMAPHPAYGRHERGGTASVLGNCCGAPEIFPLGDG
jgi:hypothetical protein